MQLASDIFGASPLRKMEDVVAVTGNNKVQGSMEHFIDTVRDPLIAGSGCPYAPKQDETGAVKHDYDSPGPHHYPCVEATFDDRGIVHCYDCGKYWEVPFDIQTDGDKSSVVTGEPKERAQAFISPDALSANDDDGDEPEETT